MTEHTIRRSKGPNGQMISHVEPVIDPLETLRIQLGTQAAYLQAERAEMAFDNALRISRMHDAIPGVTVTGIDLSDPSIGKTSSK